MPTSLLQETGKSDLKFRRLHLRLDANVWATSRPRFVAPLLLEQTIKGDTAGEAAVSLFEGVADRVPGFAGGLCMVSLTPRGRYSMVSGAFESCRQGSAGFPDRGMIRGISALSAADHVRHKKRAKLSVTGRARRANPNSGMLSRLANLVV